MHPGMLMRRTFLPIPIPSRLRAAAARAVALGVLLLALARPAAAADSDGDCHVGAYQLGDGRIVDVGSSSGGLRWRGLDGTSGKLTADGAAWSGAHGWTGRPDGLRVAFGPCGAGTMDFGGAEGRRLDLVAEETAFVSGGVRLEGRLVMPPGRGRVPIVVLLHGAERDPARRFEALQRILPGLGVGAFVYDKRGTGASGGTYTQDFALLAQDAVAALGAARRLAGPRAGRLGFHGPSQGGWVAPMAAARSRVDFVIVSFGLAVSVQEEDLEAIALQMTLKGHGPEAIRKAQEISMAAGRVWGSGFTTGFEAFEVVRARYRAEPWFKDVQGNFTHVFLGMTPEALRRAGPDYAWGTPLDHDPMPTLRALRAPQLWVLGGQDVDAPSAETARRLRGLISSGSPITLALYPTAEHGLTEFEVGADGSRLSTRYADGYFRMMRDFATHGRVTPPYGDAQVEEPHPSSR